MTAETKQELERLCAQAVAEQNRSEFHVVHTSWDAGERVSGPFSTLDDADAEMMRLGDTGRFTEAGSVNLAVEQVTFRECNTYELCAQIGRMNILAISGGRVLRRSTGVTLPVHYGYSVTVDLAANDTYTVRRVFRRGNRSWIKGEVEGVYCEQVGEVAYRASCFQNVAFG